MKKIILSACMLSLLFIAFSSFKKVMAQAPLNTTEKSAGDSQSDFLRQGTGNYLIDSATAYDYINRYEDKIRTPFLSITNDKLSKAVWFDIKALENLLNYLKDPKLNVDGVRLYLLSYKDLNTADGQYKKHQISVVLVPTLASAQAPTK